MGNAGGGISQGGGMGNGGAGISRGGAMGRVLLVCLFRTHFMLCFTECDDGEGSRELTDRTVTVTGLQMGAMRR